MLLSYREELAMRLDLTEARVQVSSKKGKRRARVGKVGVEGCPSNKKKRIQSQALKHEKIFQMQAAN